MVIFFALFGHELTKILKFLGQSISSKNDQNNHSTIFFKKILKSIPKHMKLISEARNVVSYVFVKVILSNKKVPA